MALNGTFTLNLNNGQIAGGGQSVSLSHVINQPLNVAVSIMNTSQVPVDWAFIQVNPHQVSPPFANFFPSFAIVSNQLMGQNPTPLFPGQSLSAGVEVQHPTVVGQSLDLTFTAFLQQNVVPPQQFNSSINLHVTGIAVPGTGDGGITPPDPTPSSGLVLSPLGIALIGVGGLAIVVALSGEK